jgi:acyl-CoA thioesterase-1
VGLIVLVGRNRGEIANLRSAPPEGGIVIVGDSLAAGVGARPEESFPSLLSASLGCRITNAGVSGNTTADGLARIDRILAGRPWIVVVELGGNDFLGKIDKGETRRNLDEILRRIAASGSIPAVAAIELGLFTDEYGDIFEEAARRNRAFLIPDILGGVLGKPSLMADGIHPNAAGYRIVADRLDDHLRTLIARTGATCR